MIPEQLLLFLLKKSTENNINSISTSRYETVKLIISNYEIISETGCELDNGIVVNPLTFFRKKRI